MHQPNSLLLYKQRPARLVQAGDRLEIELEGGEMARVRPKDVTLLHPGPIKSISELKTVQPASQTVAQAIEEAWELLGGEPTSLGELAELVFGSYTPATAWATWQRVAEGLYFEGSPEEVRMRSAQEVAHRRQEREQAAAHQQAWKSFLARLRQGQVSDEDRPFLQDVEQLALNRSERSQVLRELGRVETPENAHALLLELGAWQPALNPYPTRLGAPLRQPELAVPPLPDEPRRDLTHLQAYAIDDEGTDTPDDALSLELLADGMRVWVHVADVAALVPPDSPLDLEARDRGMSLHIPEGTLHLLPRAVTRQLGLGLNEVGPALSFAIDLSASGQVRGFEITPSMLRVQRLTYAQAEERLGEAPFTGLEGLANAVREQRRQRGAVLIDFPEVRITAEAGQVEIRPLPPLRSRALVEEMMILTGSETARFATAQGLMLPFSQQEAAADLPALLPQDEFERRNESLAAMFALRRLLKRSRVRLEPAPHSGLGVESYTQATSPLRRYLDLVVHQQLRAYLAGRPLLSETQLMERLGAVETSVATVRQAETLSERHWTMVYLLQHPDWQGDGILVDKRGSTGIVIIPSLAVETRLHLPRDLPLDGIIPLALSGVNLPQREATFRIVRR